MNCNNNEKSTRGMEVPCFLIGLGTGIVMTMLYAPLSGDATRKLISRRAKEGQDWVQEQAAAAGDYVTSSATGLRDRAKEVAEVIGRH